jgi:hypothetical protein
VLKPSKRRRKPVPPPSKVELADKVLVFLVSQAPTGVYYEQLLRKFLGTPTPPRRRLLSESLDLLRGRNDLVTFARGPGTRYAASGSGIARAGTILRGGSPR